MSLKRSINDKHVLDILKGGGIAFFFYALNLILVYFIAVFISKYYGAEAYGRFSIIKSLILILIIIGSLGLNTLAIKLSSDSNHFKNSFFSSNYLKKSYLIISISSLLISVLIFSFKREIATFIFNDVGLEEYLTVFPFLLLAAIFLNYNSNLFKGQGRVLLFAIVSSFLSNFLLLGVIVLVYNWYSQDEFYLILAFFISVLVSFVVSLFYVFPLNYAKNVEKLKVKKLLSYSLPMMISSSMIYIIFSVDILMLGIFETSENVGIYRIVTQIASLNTIFVIAFGTVIGPKISKLFSENKKEELRQTIANASKLIFFVTLPILVLILIFSNEILSFFGANYLNGLNSLLLLSISQFLFALTGFVDLIMNMTNNQKAFGKITIACAILNLLLNLALIPKYGIFGAAMATSFSMVFTNLLAVIYIKKNLKVLSLYIPFYGYKTKKNNA